MVMEVVACFNPTQAWRGEIGDYSDRNDRNMEDYGLTHLIIKWRLESMVEDYNNGSICPVRSAFFSLSMIPAIPSSPRSLCIIQCMIPGFH
jgi:hypothetical protein